MKLSPLQIARYQYQPKLPGMLRNGIAEICVKNGEPTQSVADQEKIAALFPNTYGKNEITFQKGENTSVAKVLASLRKSQRSSMTKIIAYSRLFLKPL